MVSSNKFAASHIESEYFDEISPKLIKGFIESMEYQLFNEQKVLELKIKLDLPASIEPRILKPMR